MKRYSRYNIFSRIRDSQNYFILNLLTGNADILSPAEAGFMNNGRGDLSTYPESLIIEMSEKGYLLDDDEEKKLYRKRYLDFLDSREADEVQIFFVTNYSCNFACSYCYQDQYHNPSAELTGEVTDSFFGYIGKEFSNRKKYITLFGGEPLLPGKRQKEMISYILRRASESNLETCIVTNGYTLKDYIPLLVSVRIREVQVTLDGTGEMHNSRRSLKSGGGTFSEIVEGIDLCLDRNISVNLRVVLDRENISGLKELATFAIEKGWTSNPIFKTQIGRNYELHHCQSSPEKLFDRISLFEKIFEMTLQYPHILKFHKPAYSVTRFLSENGELPDPLFDSCPACKTEWAFDYTGRIYSCTATVGKTDESLGTFHPVVSRNENLISQWKERDVTSIPKCRECSLQLACGGGCGSVARNSTGGICSPDCRPVKELMELGFSAYFNSV